MTRLVSIAIVSIFAACNSSSSSPAPGGGSAAARSGKVPVAPAVAPAAGSAAAPERPPPTPNPMGPVTYDPAAPPAPGGFGMPGCDELRGAVVRIEGCKAVAEPTRQAARKAWETMAQRFRALAERPGADPTSAEASCKASAGTYDRIATQAGC